MFVRLTEQQFPQQVFAVGLAPERTPPEEALMIQSEDVAVPLHHHISRLLGGRKKKTPTLDSRVSGTVCGRSAAAAVRSGQGLELSERFGTARQVWFGAREVGSAPSPALGKHSTAPVDVLADRQEKQPKSL